jgi:hypothetical protein
MRPNPEAQAPAYEPFRTLAAEIAARAGRGSIAECWKGETKADKQAVEEFKALIAQHPAYPASIIYAACGVKRSKPKRRRR